MAFHRGTIIIKCKIDYEKGGLPPRVKIYNNIIIYYHKLYVFDFFGSETCELHNGLNG